MTSRTDPTYPLPLEISTTLPPNCSNDGETKECLSIQVLPLGPPTRRTSASAVAATLQPRNTLRLSETRWPSSSITSNGSSCPTMTSVTSRLCSPLPPSRTRETGSLASSVTTPGTGPGDPSTKPLSRTHLPRPCSLAEPCRESCTTAGTQTPSSDP